MPLATKERIDMAYLTMRNRNTISVSSLARSKAWRDELPAAGIMEVTDRGDRCGWLVADEDMQELMACYLAWREAQEKAAVQAIIEERSLTRNPLAGEVLNDAAARYLLDNAEAIRSLIDGTL